MAGNPLIPTGTINRLRASVSWNSFPTLNVSASFLTDEGIRMSLEGSSTTRINAMAGVVTSPEPYQPITVRIPLLISQNLAQLYKAKMEDSTLLGDGVIRPVANTLSPYQISNASIEAVEPQDYGGRSAAWVISVTGAYYINNSAWG
jgi:hypothetical protein